MAAQGVGEPSSVSRRNGAARNGGGTDHSFSRYLSPRLDDTQVVSPLPGAQHHAAPLSSLAFSLILILAAPALAEAPKPLKILFLGDNGHHQPAERFRQLQPVLAERGIDLTYTDKVDALNPKTLAGYDGLSSTPTPTKITPEQEKALLDYVEGGKGFIPLHCASYCFLNSPKYIALVGAQFQQHNTGTFRTDHRRAGPSDHEGLQAASRAGTRPTSTPSTTRRTAPSSNTATEGDTKEPWTWVRTQGKGRVFYTAWGHDERTWSNPGFQNLVERGIRWAVGSDPTRRRRRAPFDPTAEMTPMRKDVKPFEYVDAKVPFYPPAGHGAAGRAAHEDAECR